MVPTVFDTLVEVIASKESPSQGLNRADACHKIPFHSFSIGLLIVVLLATDGTSPLLAFIALKLLKAVKTSLVEDMSTAEDCLLLKSKLFVTNRARLLVIEPVQGLLLNVFPLLLA